MKKICIMHQASIGDTLMATPVYRAIKECYPDCETVVITSYTGYELLYGNPHIDLLLPYRKGDDAVNIVRSIWRSDAAVVFDYHYRNAFYAFLALIPKRIGYGKDFINIRMKDEPLEMFEPLKYLAVVKQLGIQTEDLSLTRPYVSSEEKERIIGICNSIKKQHKKLVLIVPYSLDKLKDWEVSKYREIIRRLQENDCAVVMSGGIDEFDPIHREFPNVTNLAGKTNLRESAELINQSDLQICGCTAMLHISSTTKTHSIAIYGPSNPMQWAPKKNCTVITHNFPCSPCHNIPGKPLCKDNKCLKEISVDEVWSAIQKILL